MGISSSQGGKVRRGRAIGVKDRDLSNPRPAPSLRFLSAVEDPAQKKKKEQYFRAAEAGVKLFL